MQYTNKVSVLRNLLLKHVPVDEPESTDTNLYLYIQDCSASLDYYVMAQSSEFMDMFALVDALQNPYVLDLEYVPLSELEGHKLLCNDQSQVVFQRYLERASNSIFRALATLLFAHQDESLRRSMVSALSPTV